MNNRKKQILLMNRNFDSENLSPASCEYFLLRDGRPVTDSDRNCSRVYKANNNFNINVVSPFSPISQHSKFFKLYGDNTYSSLLRFSVT